MRSTVAFDGSFLLYEMVAAQLFEMGAVQLLEMGGDIFLRWILDSC